MLLDNAPRRARRRPSLTPMIDVVFLLLVFFMLASRFGLDAALRLPLASGGGTAYDGPPRLVSVAPETLALNGQPVAIDVLAARLAQLMQAPGDIIVLRPADGATLQRVVAVADALRQAGFARVVLIE
ncbi:MAG: indolepyruvate ferredoxin oxidoreductase [Pseudooceanicola sp.]|nr:indolepyruvate ferredoxin oxidoreductase [Pseudooceanicola sp.]